MTTLNLTEQLVTEHCISCGVHFAVPISYQQQRVADQRNYWCPNGHQQHYTGKTEAQKLRDQLERTEREKTWAENRAKRLRDEADAERRQHAATKGQLTKARKRAAAALCPCCNRTFAQMSEHLRTQHPEYVETTLGARA